MNGQFEAEHLEIESQLFSSKKLKTMAGDADANASENLPAVVNGNPFRGSLDLSAPTHAIKENTSACSNASAAPQVSTSLTPFNDSYLGQHGHSKQTQKQFLTATLRPEGETPLDMVRSNSDGIIRRKSSLRLGHFDGPAKKGGKDEPEKETPRPQTKAAAQTHFDGPANHFYTEGTGTVQKGSS